MFKTRKMCLVELLVLRHDADRVIEYLGNHANFQPQGSSSALDLTGPNEDRDVLDRLQLVRGYLGLEDADSFTPDIGLPSVQDAEAALALIGEVESLRSREQDARATLSRLQSALEEARAFAKLKVPFSELDHLAFFSFRIGRIDPAAFDDLATAVGDRAVLVPLDEGRARVLAASSKKGRFALDTELKRFSFVPIEVPKDFTGVPDELIAGLERQVAESASEVERVAAERASIASSRAAEVRRLTQEYSLASQVRAIRSGLESTQSVYRLTGWVAADARASLMKDLDDLTEARVAMRIFDPGEVPSVISGAEKVPVQYRHGPVTRSFERMIFSYGAPLYGTIDPTPVVAFFFTVLFGIMFGDVGQGLVFFALGISLVRGWIRPLAKWRHFGPLFAAIGLSSMVMGFVTGEFFANGTVLAPVSRWITGLFGEPRERVLELMPSRDALDKLLYFFCFTLAIGFIINSMGLVINIVNQFSLGRPARAVFSKNGICGAAFFWYAVFMALRIALGGAPFGWYDAVALATPAVVLFFASPLTRLVEGERPVLENGAFAAVIEGFVEVLEVVSTYISNSVSFLRVGAFALSHAVLSYIVFTMSDLVGGALSAGGLAIGVFGNAVIIVLEGLIVAIQVVRLQYYEFFSKFFTETGKEFTPFRFTYRKMS